MHGGAAADYFRSTAYQPYTAGPTTAMFHPHQVSSAVSGSMFHHHPHPAALAAAAAQQQMAAAASGAVMPHPSFGTATPGGHNPAYGAGGVIAPHPQRLFPAAAAAAAAAVVGGGPGNNHLFSQTSSHLHQQQHQQQMYEQLSGKEKNIGFPRSFMLVYLILSIISKSTNQQSYCFAYADIKIWYASNNYALNRNYTYDAKINLCPDRKKTYKTKINNHTICIKYLFPRFIKSLSLSKQTLNVH